MPAALLATLGGSGEQPTVNRTRPEDDDGDAKHASPLALLGGVVLVGVPLVLLELDLRLRCCCCWCCCAANRDAGGGRGDHRAGDTSSVAGRLSPSLRDRRGDGTAVRNVVDRSSSWKVGLTLAGGTSTIGRRCGE